MHTNEQSGKGFGLRMEIVKILSIGAVLAHTPANAMHEECSINAGYLHRQLIGAAQDSWSKKVCNLTLAATASSLSIIILYTIPHWLFPDTTTKLEEDNRVKIEAHFSLGEQALKRIKRKLGKAAIKNAEARTCA